MKIDEKLIEKAFILFLIALGIFYIYLASQTKMLGEDEAFFYDMGKKFSQSNYPPFDNLGRPISLSPFVPLTFTIPFMIFGSSIELAKIIISLFGILTVLLVYLIGKKINIYYGIISAFLLFSANLFTHFMLIVYLEIPIAFFSILATYMFLNLNSYKRAILAGAVISLAFSVKQTGLFLLAGLVIYKLILYLHQKDVIHIKTMLMVIFASVILMTPFLIKNIIAYNYPYTYFLNNFFNEPKAPMHWEGVTGKVLSTPMLTIQTYAANLSWLLVISIIFSLVWFLLNIENKKAPKELLLPTILSSLFILLYYIFYFLDMGISEPRNIFIIFPQLSLVGGFFLWKLKEYKKYFILLILVVCVLSLYMSVQIAIGTSSSQRYPDNYIQALEWIKKNTDKSDIILTTYSGSVKYFAERDVVWGVKDLPEVMSTTNSTFIYNAMKKYNVSYILVWRGILGDRFIVPESNLIGIFTYNFLNNVISDNTHFNVTYQNQDNIVFKVL